MACCLASLSRRQAAWFNALLCLPAPVACNRNRADRLVVVRNGAVVVVVAAVVENRARGDPVAPSWDNGCSNSSGIPQAAAIAQGYRAVGQFSCRSLLSACCAPMWPASLNLPRSDESGSNEMFRQVQSLSRSVANCKQRLDVGHDRFSRLSLRPGIDAQSAPVLQHRLLEPLSLELHGLDACAQCRGRRVDRRRLRCE